MWKRREGVEEALTGLTAPHLQIGGKEESTTRWARVFSPRGPKWSRAESSNVRERQPLSRKMVGTMVALPIGVACAMSIRSRMLRNRRPLRPRSTGTGTTFTRADSFRVGGEDAWRVVEQGHGHSPSPGVAIGKKKKDQDIGKQIRPNKLTFGTTIECSQSKSGRSTVVIIILIDYS
jgi:hypothetical protein